jgi:hypothetical protein
LKQVEALLARAGALPVEAEEAVEKLLNVVETLCADKNELTEEVQRLRKQLEQKKKDKTHAAGKPDDDQATPRHSNHSSEKQRRQRNQKRRAARDRRSFKDVPIHEEVECPVDPVTLPPDAVRVADETVIVQSGLASTAYQQTDDTSARVKGQFWHTHILCNPYYAAYFMQPHKDRLTLLDG